MPYSGAWHPSMGGGDEDDTPSPRSLPQRAGAYDPQRARQERVRAEAWMRGFEPVVSYEAYGGADGVPVWHALYVEFPGSPHRVGVAERIAEYGKLDSWCFHCHVTDCGACRWARSLYVQWAHDGFDLTESEDAREPF